MTNTLLDVRDLSVRFCMYDQGFEQKDIQVIQNLNVSVREGEVVAVAGSSGSGKSLLAHAVLGILPSNAHVTGEMRFYGEALTCEAQERLRGREIALVPQSVAFLDPLLRVGNQVRGVFRKGEWEGVLRKQRTVFTRYGLGIETENLFPFQLSGGMARRVLVSTAAIADAKLIIADEPMPGLSVELAKSALSHFRALADGGRGVLLITHDIDLALDFADRIAVFYAGTTVEVTSAADFKTGPAALRHPYTKALWKAIPQNGFESIPGSQPAPGENIEGCLFAPRCPHTTAACGNAVTMRNLRGGEVRCVNAV